VGRRRREEEEEEFFNHYKNDLERHAHLIRALGKETGHPIMAFHRPSFFPSVERGPHHTTTENPLLVGDPSP